MGKGLSEELRTQPQFGVYNKARIYVKNNNNLCLFYALELGRLYHDRHEIQELKKNKQSIP